MYNQPQSPAQGQGQPPAMGGGGSNLARYEQSKTPAPTQTASAQTQTGRPDQGAKAPQPQQNFVDHARDTLQGYRSGATGMNRTDQYMNSIENPAMGTPAPAQAPAQAQAPQTNDYTALRRTPNDDQQRLIDTINAMNYHKIDPFQQNEYAKQLGYSPQEMAAEFPAPGAQVAPAMQVPMGAPAMVGGGGQY